MDFTQALAGANGNGRHGGGGIDAFDSIDAAPEFAPVPPGVYKARVARGELRKTKADDDCYRVRFEIVEGPHKGQSVFRTWTFNKPNSIAYAKRDLALFGLTTSDHLRAPFPPTDKDVSCRLVVALQRGDDGIEHNDVKRIDQVRIVDSPAARFMLPPGQSEGGSR